MPNIWKRWKYPYLTLTIIGVLIAIILAENDSFRTFLLKLGSLEYIGIIVGGMLFVTSFTVAIGAVIIGILAQNLHPLMIGLIGGIGAVIGDLLIFKFVRDHLKDELKLLFGKDGTSYLRKVIRSRYIAWTLPIIGVFIIASPLPDELGVSLLGLSKMSETKFILISYISNSLGILAIAAVAKVL